MTKDNFRENTSGDTSEHRSAMPLLSRAECNIMRGLAIIFIITNNFTHLLKGVFPDNEYKYDWQNVVGFMNNLSHPDAVLPFNLISFYCPYGVMLFIFLSGYGLVLKYVTISESPTIVRSSFFSFITHRPLRLCNGCLVRNSCYFYCL